MQAFSENLTFYIYNQMVVSHFESFNPLVDCMWSEGCVKVIEEHYIADENITQKWIETFEFRV